MSNQSKTICVNANDDLSSIIESEPILKIQTKDHNTSQDHKQPRNNKISRQHNNSLGSNPAETPPAKHDNKEYHNISTKTFENIIQKLDNFDDNTSVITNENTEYVTKEKVSTLITEIKVDILSVVNLLDSLNETVNNNNNDINNIKQAIRVLMNENLEFKKKIAKTNVENDKKYNSLCIAFDVKFNDLQHNLKETYSHREIINNDKIYILNDDDKNVGDIKVMKRNPKSSQDTSDIDTYSLRYDNESSDSVNGDKHEQTNVNIYVDSQMDKRASKFKIVKPRTKNATNDVFGIVEQKEEGPNFNGNFRQVARTEVIENKLNSQTDTSTSRANRLNLQSNCVVDKVCSKRI
jgi:hypothetical protein